MSYYINLDEIDELMDNVTDLLNRIDGVLVTESYDDIDMPYSDVLFQAIDELYSAEGVDRLFTEIILDNMDYDRGEYIYESE